jgi:hypothetical protein
MPEEITDLFFQGRQFVCGSIPDDRQLDPEIDMGEYIAESCDLFPVSMGIPFPKLGRKILDRFTDDQKIPDDRVPASVVVQEVFE